MTKTKANDKKSFGRWLKNTGERLLTMLYPSRCVFCDRVIEGLEYGCCSLCRADIIREPICKSCGKQLQDRSREFCDDCSRLEHEFIEGRALYTYDEVKDSIYRLKYDNRREYAVYYGKMLGKYYGKWLKDKRVQAIIPVPLHKSRLRKRGYNQALLLAETIGRYLDIPVRTDIIQRVKNTKPLKLLGLVQRRDNLKKAFKLCCNDVKLKAVVIIDDIFTTGSTVDEISAVLKKAGVGEVYFLTVAIGGQ